MPILMRMVVIAAMLLPAGAGYADGLMVDPSKVKPEYRAAAEKRAAEQKKLVACQKDADEKKLLPRDRTKFLSDCLDK
jgi:psiF repeat